MKRELPTLSQILIVSFLLRLVWALLIPVIPLSDSMAYDVFATNIWLHKTYGWEAQQPSSYWPVGTSAIYSILYTIFGHTYWPIVVLNCVISIVIINVSYRLCQRFFPSPQERIATLTALALALWPTMIFYTTVLSSELLYLFFSLLALHWFFNACDGERYSWPTILSSGACFAAAYYVRPLITVPLIIALLSAVLVLHCSLRRVLSVGASIGIVMALAVAPWAYRNYQLHDAFVPMSSNSGAVFWMGNQPGTDGGYLNTPAAMKGMDTHLRSQKLKAEAIEYIKAEPLAFVQRTLYKLVRFHSYETIGVSWNEQGIRQRFGAWAILPLKLLTTGYWSLLIITAFAGLIMYGLREGLWPLCTSPFALLWGSSAAIHALIVSQDRYHIPVVPFIAAFAAYAIHLCVYRAPQATSTLETH